MNPITWWRNRQQFVRWALGLSFTLWLLVLFFWGLIYVVNIPARRVAIWTAVVIWFFHVFVGAGAGFAAWRLWPDRDNPFVRRIIIAIHGFMISGLMGVVLLFLSRGVVFTWKFTITLFVGVAIIDCVMLPLLLYIIRGPQHEPTEIPNRSGDKPSEFWEERFNRIEKKIDRLKDGS